MDLVEMFLREHATAHSAKNHMHMGHVGWIREMVVGARAR